MEKNTRKTKRFSNSMCHKEPELAFVRVCASVFVVCARIVTAISGH